MKKKRILWFCLYQYTDENISKTGTWLESMLKALIQTNEVEIFNITYAPVKSYQKFDYKCITQWVLPLEKLDKKGLPSPKTINFIKNIELEINPDLVHIWGTENYFGMLAARKILSTPVLLDMQGLLEACANVYYGGLSNKELLQCIGIKEILVPIRALYFRKLKYEKASQNERYIIKKQPFISVQSEWIRTQVEHQNPTCKIYSTGVMLRKEFSKTPPWSVKLNQNPVIFTSSAESFSFKGLHVLIRALAILKSKYPTIQLRVAGDIQKVKFGFIKDGYTKWLINEAKKLNVLQSIIWLGGLNAEQIIEQFHASSLVVIPSYVESYSLTLAEAMIVGVPTVVSYAGAMPELAQDNESALFFPIGDVMACAYQIEKLISNQTLAKKISIQSRAKGLIRNNKDSIIKNQLEIYNDIIDKTLCK